MDAPVHSFQHGELGALDLLDSRERVTCGSLVTFDGFDGFDGLRRTSKLQKSTRCTPIARRTGPIGRR